MKTFNDKINESFDDMEKTVERIHEFIKDVEKMRQLQIECINPRSDKIAAMVEAQSKVDAFLAKRNEV